MEPITHDTDSKEPNWNEISKGKVRHGVACEYIKQNKPLNEEIAMDIERWVEFIMTGHLENHPF